MITSHKMSNLEINQGLYFQILHYNLGKGQILFTYKLPLSGLGKIQKEFSNP